MSDQRVREVLRGLGIGRFVYWAWHAPFGSLKRLRKEGTVNLALARAGRRNLEALAWQLPASRSANRNAVRVHMLTGRRFVEQTAICAWSLADLAPDEVSFTFVDDGTLAAPQVALLGRLFPGSVYRSPGVVEEALAKVLPRDQFPALRALRLVYPHIRKLTDVHSEGDGWKLVLDSDMVFHRRPAWMLDWMAEPERPCHMLDIADAYGYPMPLLEGLAGRRIPARVNVGLCGLRSDAIDWPQLERWTSEILANAGRHYLLEQGLTAMLMAGTEAQVAPEEDYILAPSRDETLRPRGVLHHYVAESKSWYFRDAWKHVRARAEAAGRADRLPDGAMRSPEV